jgi:hypothetical protein
LARTCAVCGTLTAPCSAGVPWTGSPAIRQSLSLRLAGRRRSPAPKPLRAAQRFQDLWARIGRERARATVDDAQGVRRPRPAAQTRRSPRGADAPGDNPPRGARASTRYPPRTPAASPCPSGGRVSPTRPVS